MCSIVMATTPQEHEHTIWFVLSVVSIGCTDNPFNGMKPASDLSSHKGTDAPVVMATGNKRAQGITLNCYSNMNTICTYTYVHTHTHTHTYTHQTQIDRQTHTTHHPTNKYFLFHSIQGTQISITNVAAYQPEVPQNCNNDIMRLVLV